jgi:hypothetical protein
LAIDKYNEKGRFGQSAKYHKDIAGKTSSPKLCLPIFNIPLPSLEMYEAGTNMEQAVNHYRQAANLYVTDNKKTSASPCLLKIASIQSLNDQFTDAASIFESIGKECTESRLGQFSAKGHFMSCIMCHLAAGNRVASSPCYCWSNLVCGIR